MRDGFALREEPAFASGKLFTDVELALDGSGAGFVSTTGFGAGATGGAATGGGGGAACGGGAAATVAGCCAGAPLTWLMRSRTEATFALNSAGRAA